MSITLDIINPLTYPDWDDLLLSSEDYSFFHSRAWAQVLQETFGYKPYYFVRTENHKLSLLIPMMEVNSFITGRRGVSLPFSDYCPIIMEETYNKNDIMKFIIDYGQKRSWQYIEFRDNPMFNNFSRENSFTYYYTHLLDLEDDEIALLSTFRDSTGRNIKKALKEGVKVSISNTNKSLAEFYRLYCLTRKRHGAPPQSYKFFTSVYRNIILNGLGNIILASYKGVPIAGAIFFHFGNRAIYKYAASDMAYQHLRANNLVLWEGIRWYSSNKFRKLSLGRTEPDNKGLQQFKTGWGVKGKIISYYRYDLKQDVFIKGAPSLAGRFKKILHGMPLWMLKIAGHFLYKHAG